jgi:hypothetical protein
MARSLHRFLLRGFIDLSPTGIGSVQVLNPQAAYAHAVTGADYCLPIQYNPAGKVRERILREIGEHDYLCDDPAAVRPGTRTAEWSRFVEWSEGFEYLSQAAQRNLIILSQTLGLYRHAGRLAERGLRHRGEDKDTDSGRWLSGALLMSRFKDTGAEQDRRRLFDDRAAAACSERVELSQRLSAALFLIVAYSKAKPADPAQARHWRTVAESLYLGFRPEDHWTRLAFASSYWRGISFIPFHSGTRDQVTRELDRAEEYARAMPSGSFAEDVSKRQQLHPLYETRIREAIWLGDLDLAGQRAAEFVRLDPLEPKAHVTAGDVALRAGDTGLAVRRYVQAAVLGPPYTVLARYKLGCVLRDRGDLPAALTAFVQGLMAEPGAVTCAREVAALARECDDEVSLRWADQLSAAAGGHGKGSGR